MFDIPETQNVVHAEIITDARLTELEAIVASLVETANKVAALIDPKNLSPITKTSVVTPLLVKSSRLRTVEESLIYAEDLINDILAFLDSSTNLKVVDGKIRNVTE